MRMHPALLLLPAIVAPLAAQEEPAPEQGPLMRFRMQRLQEGVGLSQDQAQRIVQRWRRYDLEHFERQRQLKALRVRFNDVLLGPGTEAERSDKLRPLLEQFIDIRRQQADLREKFEEDIRGQLTPTQQVRLILMIEDMAKQLQETFRERRQERRGMMR
ncbi:MAG TPA: hypothetical protein VJ600_10430 [Holophagaceae bacterium]|nr:hypothetical protein [Holophagaceae bacterium]